VTFRDKYFRNPDHYNNVRHPLRKKFTCPSQLAGRSYPSSSGIKKPTISDGFEYGLWVC